MPRREKWKQRTVEGFPHAQAVGMRAAKKMGAIFSGVTAVRGAGGRGTETKLELLGLEWE